MAKLVVRLPRVCLACVASCGGMLTRMQCEQSFHQCSLPLCCCLHRICPCSGMKWIWRIMRTVVSAMISITLNIATS